MPEPDLRTLVVDDEVLYARAVARELGRLGMPCKLAHTAGDALRQVESTPFDLVLLDNRLPDEEGLAIIPRLLARQPRPAVMMMTAHETIPQAVTAIRQGAEDYVVKETSLGPLVERVLEIRRRVFLRRSALGWQEHRKDGLLGTAPAMEQIRLDLEKLRSAPETTVLISGETGVGKEVAARSLHQLTRPDSPMVAIDCVALPGGLAESHLFGHERGAFTGADRARAGAFEEAGDGTVFLDEIGDMEPALQGKLLRVLESRVFCRLGSHRTIPLRARVVAASNRDLARRVEEGHFRMDLYQRLSVFPVQLPPLRQRQEDILPLAEHFHAFFGDKLGRPVAPLDATVAERLEAYSYPGNVRELKNIIERAVIISESGRIELSHLPPRVLAEPCHGARRGPAIPLDFVPGADSLESVERRMIKTAMDQAGNVKAEAARLLGISRYQLLRRLQKYGLGD